VARVVHPDGTSEAEPQDAGERLLSERAARAMTSIMEGVTEVGGTARAAAIDGYSVAGKTGTAQKVSGGHYDSTKWVSSFIGFAPAQDPRIALVVMVDEPQGGHLGGAIAAPIFKEIAEQALRYLHVAPSREALARGPGQATSPAPSPSRGSEVDEQPGSDVSTVEPDEVRNDDGDGAGQQAQGEALTEAQAEVEADPPDTEPSSAAEVQADPDGSGAKLALEAPGDRPGGDDVTVPDFRGLSVAAVLRAARQNGVALMFDDPQSVTGVAVAQSPGPGKAPPGATCRVAFGVVP
jgi:membrane peptidoglycan carboxypeptidase